MKNRKYNYFIWAFPALLIFFNSCTNVIEPEGNNTPKPQPGDIKILIIGNSYTGYNDFPVMFRDFCASKGKKVFIGNGIVYGRDLEEHSKTTATFSLIESEKWDFVILQDSGPNIGYPGDQNKIFPPYTRSNIYEAIVTLSQAVKMNSTGSKIVLFMPWALEEGITYIPGQTDTYEIMQKRIYDNCVLWAESLNFILSPVGWAFNEVLKTNKEPHYLYANDSNHPSVRGSYLMGCVFFKSIFNESPMNSTYYSILGKTEAEYFQKTAAELLLE